MKFILVLCLICVLFVIGTMIESALNGNLTKKYPQFKKASDGHFIPKEKDISCENQYGHVHRKMDMTNVDNARYIVHEDPETGYVILNGVKRRIEDCKNL